MDQEASEKSKRATKIGDTKFWFVNCYVLSIVYANVLKSRFVRAAAARDVNTFIAQTHCETLCG